MSNIVRKIFSFLLVIVILVGIIPMNVVAAESSSTEFEYNIKNNEVTITRYVGSSKKVVIPAKIEGCSVTSIGGSAFNFNSLTNITIPNSVTSIGDYAFYDCDSLTNITIPSSVTSIGDEAFHACELLTSINVSENNKNYSSVDGVLFNKDKTMLICCPSGKKSKYYEIPNSVTNIGHDAFFRCDSLTNITIPSSVTSIGGSAFYNCDSLTNITIPNSVTSIGDYAFCDCDSLTNITIHNGVTSIGDNAFHSCDLLTNITIPDSVTSIGDEAFEQCDSLASITILSSVTSIGDDVFRACESLTSINVSENNKNYSSVDGVLFNKDKTMLICYPSGKKSKYYEIPNSVTSIGDEAFEYCDSLASITIPNSVTSIGDDAFYDCDSLTNITIHNSVTSIGDYAFYGCKSLKDVYYNGSKLEWGKISVGQNNDSLKNATIHFNSKDETFLNLFETSPFKVGGLTITGYNGKAENVVIPEEINGKRVIAIGDNAFKKCEWIKTITLPKTIKEIEQYAFCREGSLTDIYFDESRAIWSDVMVSQDVLHLIKEKVQLHCKTTLYTSEPDRCLAVGKSFYMMAQVDFPKDATISVSLSNDKTIKLGNIKDGDSLVSFVAEHIPGNDFSKYIKFDVIGDGIVDICISVKTKDGTSYFYDTMYCYDESLDYYSVYRAENIENKKWDGDLINDKDEEYCGWVDGIVMSDFNYSKATKDGKSGWVFNINAYNGRSNNGICEVFDSEGKLVDAVCIEPYEIKAFDGIYTLGETIGNCFCKVSEHGVSFKTTRTETRISVFVPDGGYMRITNDMALSSLCAFYNFVDIVFLMDDFVESFNHVMDGEKVSAPKFKSAVTESVLNCYINGVEKAFETKTEVAVKSYLTEGFSKNTMLKFCDMLTAVAVTKDGLADAGSSLVDSASNELLKFFKVNEAFDMYSFLATTADAAFTVEDIISTTGYNKSFHIYADVDKESVKKFLERSGVSVDTRGNVDPEAVLYTYKILNDDEIIMDLENGELINEYETYEIAFIKDGYKVQPTDKVEVNIELSDKLKGKNISVLRENDDGTWEIIDCRVEDGKVIFEVDHFCVFVVAEYNANLNSKGAGNTPISKVVYIVVAAIGLSVILVAVGIIVVVKVRKKKNLAK